jgi:myosin heavy subunit
MFLGYPERMPFGEFKRRFACLLPNNVTLADALDDRIAVKGLLDSLDIDQNRYRLGISQVDKILIDLIDKMLFYIYSCYFVMIFLHS